MVDASQQGAEKKRVAQRKALVRFASGRALELAIQDRDESDSALFG
jgi:hypothetical protein